MKIAVPLLVVLSFSLMDAVRAQELKKEFLDPVPQDSRSTAVKVRGGTLLFLARTHGQPTPARRRFGELRRSIESYLRQDQEHASESRRHRR